MAILLRASKVVEGNPEEVVIESGQVIIGRLPSNHLVIPGGEVEPIHAMIEVESVTGKASLVDMASDSGVKLNGQTIEVVESLVPGDLIVIGDVTISVFDGNEQTQPMRLASGAQSGAVKESLDSDSEPMPLDKDAGAPREKKESPSNKQERIPTQKSAKRSSGSSKMDDYRYEGKVSRVPKVYYGFLFEPGKEKGLGSTLEVVAYWDQSIIDVRHYGGNIKPGEQPRPNLCFIGNEEDGHLMGIGPKGTTRNLRFAQVEGSKTTIYLNDEMRARVRRGKNYEKLVGPQKVKMSPGELAIVRHGPVNYLLMNVSLPNPVFKRFGDIDGKPFVFLYALFLYGLLSIALWNQTKDGLPEKPFDADAWGQTLAIRTPPPKVKENVPAPKPEVKVEKPEPVKPPAVQAPVPKPEPVPVNTPAKIPPVVTADKKTEKKPVENDKEKAVPQKTEKVVAPKVTAPQKPEISKKPGEDRAKGNSGARGEKPANQSGLGNKSSSQPGNGSGKAGGTAGKFASARTGNQKTSEMGVEGGKANVMSGINLDKLGAGLGKISNLDGVGAIATGLQSSSGGAGQGSGSAARGSHGLGGLGGTNSLSAGGPSRALSGLGGGGGGLGAGGLGGSSGSGAAGPGGAGKKLNTTAVVVPEGDPSVEGQLTKEEIEAVIRANLAQIKACYERFLQGNRNLAGRVSTKFVIGTNGRVNAASVASSDLGSPGAESCMIGAIRRWKFPLPRGGGVVQVTYPFVFNSK